MSENITPTSIKKSASGSTWRPFILALHDYVSNTSSNWQIENFTDNGSGNDVGFTASPTDSAENFYVNWQFDSTNLVPRLAVDPNSGITDPLDPTGTGSSEVSPNSPRAGIVDPANNDNFLDEVLIQDWDDALGMLIKHENNTHIEEGMITGRIYKPLFANNDVHELDGLGWRGGRPQDIDGNWWEVPNNYDSCSRMRIPGGWVKAKSILYDEDYNFPSWSQHFPGAYMIGDYNDEYATIGVPKYAWRWEHQSGDEGLRRVQSPNGDGFLFISYDFDDYNLVVPWDPNVSPI